MPATLPSASLIAACGLYCGACGKYASGSCPGCAQNEKASWCAVRACCRELGIANCAACEKFPDPKACAKHNNMISKIFGFVFNSDRAACVARIRAVGGEAFAAEMAASGRPSLPRHGKS